MVPEGLQLVVQNSSNLETQRVLAHRKKKDLIYLCLPWGNLGRELNKLPSDLFSHENTAVYQLELIN